MTDRELVLEALNKFPGRDWLNDFERITYCGSALSGAQRAQLQLMLQLKEPTLESRYDSRMHSYKGLA